MCGGQSSKGFLVDHHLLLSKQRNDTELNWDTVEPVYNGHPRDLRNWPLNTGGRLIQDH